MENLLLVLVPGFILVMVVIGFAGAAEERRARRMDRRLVDLEVKINALLSHHGVPLPEPEFDAVRTLALRGRKAAAVLLYRAQTDADPKEALWEVNRLSAR
ncbi:MULTISPECIES: hypothetical protein [unclassified Crossiella]|uniref:hypothetical protein n=1 Tax=unclassified Crossiella TaxID=2620835 RepID=UPI001FFFAE50|nr:MULTISPECIES: hypothetical protein [unclassified Crossiella]MCK2245268.1 hypothetical protein [Crossiella sp. S99.2]MCK2258921.1 hypothetical protein [Crossiella sp. S99.1]